MSDNLNNENSSLSNVEPTDDTRQVVAAAQSHEVVEKEDSGQRGQVGPARSHLPAIDRYPNNDLPTIPVDPTRRPPAETEQSKPKPKYIRRSLANTFDDLTFRSIRLSSPANQTFYKHFCVSTYRDFMRAVEPDRFILNHERIDDAQLPFREIVAQVDGSSVELIDQNQSLMQWSLALATVCLLYSLFKTLVSGLLLVVSDVEIGIVQMVSFAMWTAFSMFSIAMYVFYAYHNWVLERDRFGTGRHFMKDYLSLTREAVFPYAFARSWFD